MFISSHLALSPLTSRYTHVPQQFSCSDISIRVRITAPVSSMAPNIHPKNLKVVVPYICGILKRMHCTDQLGPKGIQSSEDLFIGIGYDKADCYMGLIVNAPGARAVMAVFEGDRMQIGRKMEIKPELAIEELRSRFAAAVDRKYEELESIIMAQRRR
jgi:hypothetical protein